jgi:hypothetical protein
MLGSMIVRVSACLRAAAFRPRPAGVLVAAALAIAFTGAGCRDSKPKGPTEQERNDTIARSALLTSADMPTGWTVLPGEGDPPEPWEDELDAAFEPRWSECASSQVFSEDDFHFEGELSNLDSATFESPSEETVDSTIVLFASDAAASDALKTFGADLASCRSVMDDYLHALREFQVAGEPQLVSSGYNLVYEPLNPPDIGDDTVSFRFRGTADAIGYESISEVVLFRHGRFVAIYGYFGPPASFEQGAAILQTFDARVQGSSTLFAAP